MICFIHLPKFFRRYLHILFILVIILFLSIALSASSALAGDIPLPIYPENLRNTTALSDPPLGIPSFNWSPVPGAVVYRLQVDTDASFSYPVFLDITTHYTFYTPQAVDQLLADGEWFWRVRVEDPSPSGEWSSVTRFTKTWNASANKPALLAPTEGQVVSFYNAPAFSWTRVTGAASYEVQISTTSTGFTSPLVSVNTLSASYQPDSHLVNGTYYWRVSPRDASGTLGASSEVRSFIASYGTVLVDMVPGLLGPVDESISIFTPTFHWTAVIGAEHYLLQYTSSVTCDFSLGSSIETHQVYYTPVDTFPNGRFCWRVRVESGAAVGDWSEIRHFQKRWDIKPVLLTPVELYQATLYPLYRWTSVPGASRYLIQIAQNSSFSPIYEESITANTMYAPQNRNQGTSHYWWRVLPIDGSGEAGEFSDLSDYQSIYTSTAPILISPLYYFSPEATSGLVMNPYENRSAALPIFQWHRLINPPPTGGTFATAYRLQVDDTPYFDPPLWELDTENTSVVPVGIDDFIPDNDHDYYWRVCPINYIGGGCLTKPDGVSFWWSQVWKAHFDSGLGLEPAVGETPELLRPSPGQEYVEATPLFEWWPYSGATQYQVEISRDSGFSTHEISETVGIPAFSPIESLAQRSLGRTDYGTFYWRVRAMTINGWSGWSAVWRFQIASQSEWRYTRMPGKLENRLIIGHDPTGDAGVIYDLTALYASQSQENWYLGFNRSASSADLTYVIYLDIDNLDGSGATCSPERDYKVTTIPAHQPEFAIYVDVLDGVIDKNHVWIFAWDGNSWEYGQTLAQLGGSLYVSDDYVELEIPDSYIGMSPETGSASLILFSVDITDGTVQDTVPSDPQGPGNAVLSQFTAVSDRMNLVAPPDTPSGNPSTLASFHPFFWDWPTGMDSSTPFAGFNLQVDLDPDFSSPHEATFSMDSSSSYISQNHVTLLNDIAGDQIYYWRLQPRYWLPGYSEAHGAWTQGWSFQRKGLVAQNLHTSISYAALTFDWDLAEGAQAYHLQLAPDEQFSSVVLDINTSLNTFTPTDLLPQGQYYWRVQIISFDNLESAWSQVQQFALNYPGPTGLSPDQTMIHQSPTFCWDPLVVNDDSGPTFAAWRYYVQVSTDLSFNDTFDEVDTESNCWTPTKGYKDGIFYWRVALIVDHDHHLGSFSAVGTFQKQYPSSNLISPLHGTLAATPTIRWSPVDGASTYVYEISLSPEFSIIRDSGLTVNTQFTPLSAYETGKKYFWRIAIRDIDGNQGPFSDASFFLNDRIYLPIITQ
jgi:hypothetical protein